MTDRVMKIGQSFRELPAEIRNRFRNDPEELLRFTENPQNRDEAIKLGLIRNDWTIETDGIGEQIKTEAERKKTKTDTGETA